MAMPFARASRLALAMLVLLAAPALADCDPVATVELSHSDPEMVCVAVTPEGGDPVDQCADLGPAGPRVPDAGPVPIGPRTGATVETFHEDPEMACVIVTPDGSGPVTQCADFGPAGPLVPDAGPVRIGA